MSRKSRRNKALALIGAGVLAGTMGRPSGITPMERRDKMKVRGDRTQGRKTDSMQLGKTMMGAPQMATGVDYEANPRERADIAAPIKKRLEKSKKAVEKRKKEGKLSSTMPKEKGQEYDFGFGLGAKSGRMIKASGGVSVKTKLNGVLKTKTY
tara:strand:- start:210 stop:668 length:459 start_codon:yes stop_codon:yes gene_type:complete